MWEKEALVLSTFHNAFYSIKDLFICANLMLVIIKIWSALRAYNLSFEKGLIKYGASGRYTVNLTFYQTMQF